MINEGKQEPSLERTLSLPVWGTILIKCRSKQQCKLKNLKLEIQVAARYKLSGNRLEEYIFIDERRITLISELIRKEEITMEWGRLDRFLKAAVLKSCYTELGSENTRFFHSMHWAAIPL